MFVTHEVSCKCQSCNILSWYIMLLSEK